MSEYTHHLQRKKTTGARQQATGIQQGLSLEDNRVSSITQQKRMEAMQLKGKTDLNDDVGLENEADVMGSRALDTTTLSFSSLHAQTKAGSTIQRVKKEELAVGAAYVFQGKTGYYSAFKSNKYCFTTSSGGGMSAFRVSEVQLDEVMAASQSDLVKEEPKPQPPPESYEHKAKEAASEEPDQFTGETRENAQHDNGGWLVEPPRNVGQQIDFLNNVIRVARSIIPKAFNRNAEVGKAIKADYINTAYDCKNALVYAYAADLKRNGIEVANNYIHPAALERIYEIVKRTAPNDEAIEAPMVGVCKDFASLCYGLILQNDTGNIYKPKLALMHGHVYVEVTIQGKPYAVDAWLGGAVKPKAQHETEVSSIHEIITKATHTDEVNGREYQQSLEASYGNSELARLVWYHNKGKYTSLAMDKWKAGKIEHVNRGTL